MRILVTGATGLIGKQLVHKLLEEGYEVNYLTTNKEKKEGVLIGAKGFYWNPYKGEIEENALDEVHTIIHLAGSNISESWSKAGKAKIVESRIVPSNFIYEQLAKKAHSVKQIVCSSAVGLYANSSKWQSEEQYFEADNFLGNVVSQWEAANLRFQEIGVKVSLVRIGLVLAKEGGALPQIAKMANCYLGSVLGDGKQFYSWIHIKDLVGIFLFLTKHEKEGVYNAVAPKPETNKSFTIGLSKVLNKKILLPAVPKWVLKIAIGEKAVLVVEGQRVSSAKIEKAGYVFNYCELKTALQEIYK